jgi:cysteine desulfurase
MKPTHTLIAMGLSNADAFGSLRITLGFENTQGEIDYFLNETEKTIKELRSISPLHEGLKKI